MIVLRQNNYSNLPAVVTPESTPSVAAKAGGIGGWMKANPGKTALGALAIGGTMLAAKKIKDKQKTEDK